MDENLLFVIIVLSILIGLFLLGRMIVLWYFRIDVIVDRLKEQNELSKQTNDYLSRLLTYGHLQTGAISKVQIQRKSTGETKNVSLVDYMDLYSNNQDYVIVNIQRDEKDFA